MSNKMIRRTIRKYIKRYGKQDTRIVIAKFATTFHTTKQRISGNISCMKCIEGMPKFAPTCQIMRLLPYSCRGRLIRFLSLYFPSLICQEMPYFSQLSKHFRAVAFFFKNLITEQIIVYFCKLLRPNSSKNSSKNRSKTKIPTTMDFKVQSSSTLPKHSHTKCQWHMRIFSDTFSTYP